MRNFQKEIKVNVNKKAINSHNGWENNLPF